MPHCVNARCRSAMQDAWAFCPVCGTDNRPPAARVPVASCQHRYFQGANFCSSCGLPIAAAATQTPAPPRPVQPGFVHASGAVSIVVQCPTCGKSVSSRAIACPGCGERISAMTREVNALWVFLFGCFYLLYKGWVKAAIFSFLLAAFTCGFSWVILPFFAQRFVDSTEG